jgi:hypothetical protein
MRLPTWLRLLWRYAFGAAVPVDGYYPPKPELGKVVPSKTNIRLINVR